MVFVKGNATREEYMTAYRKNRSLWKQARGVASRTRDKYIPVTKEDKKQLKAYGFSDEVIAELHNHYEAKKLKQKYRHEQKELRQQK